MQLYTGTKQVKARPMNRADYITLRGWQLPADEDGTDEGYLVEYVDGGKANVEGFAGYISWSPRLYSKWPTTLAAHTSNACT